MEDKNLFVLHSQYLGCWWPGDTGSQGISSHGMDLILPEYADVNSRRVNGNSLEMSHNILSSHFISSIKASFYFQNWYIRETIISYLSFKWHLYAVHGDCWWLSSARPIPGLAALISQRWSSYEVVVMWSTQRQRCAAGTRALPMYCPSPRWPSPDRPLD